MATDEIFESEITEDKATAELHAGGYNNEFGSKLSAFAPDAAQFNQAFTRTELGDGQVMSAAESSRLIAQHGLRQNAGAAANAALSADLEWADVRIKEQRLTGKQLERGIYQAKNVQLGNELLYQVGRIPLHAQKRHLQLQQLSNQVKELRESVKVNAIQLSIKSGDSSDIKVDFTSIEIDE
ncbi:MAG: hypothetical protein HC836_49905 [Richelia sp. RM2_1_2]|nr:hypothetical protein [Richelia sp. RM1_1_1]NJO65907.1 hypothetical protein [Richelia sp. RM2_1_2]